MHVGTQGGGDGSQRVVAALFQGPEDAHQHRLHLRPLLVAVAQAVLADDHRRADLTLGVVVVKRHLDTIQKREEVIAMAAEALAQPSRVGVVVRGVGQVAQAAVNQLDAPVVLARIEVAAFAQADAVADQAPQ